MSASTSISATATASFPPGSAAASAGTAPNPAPLVISVRAPDAAPLRKLTTGLLATYKTINSRYYAAKRERAARARGERGAEDYVVVQGDLLGAYRVEESLGRGSFGQVVTALDTRVTPPRRVAVKVIKNKEAFRRQARSEIRLLELMNRKDPEDQWCIVRFLEQFDHNGHTCLVFEHLSLNLYELLKRTHFRGVSLTLIRKFARQILKALAFLSLPEINIIHCDLKPENILFRVPNRSAIKVIDFGSSCTADKKMYKYIQSRFYRSPEVILELPYTQAIDMWSLGCILVEMHTGIPLFAGRDESDQMRRFVALKGLPPHHMLQQSKKTEQFFDVVELPSESSESAAVTTASTRSRELRRQHRSDRLAGRAALTANADGSDDFDSDDTCSTCSSCSSCSMGSNCKEPPRSLRHSDDDGMDEDPPAAGSKDGRRALDSSEVDMLSDSSAPHDGSASRRRRRDDQDRKLGDDEVPVRHGSRAVSDASESGDELDAVASEQRRQRRRTNTAGASAAQNSVESSAGTLARRRPKHHHHHRKRIGRPALAAASSSDAVAAAVRKPKALYRLKASLANGMSPGVGGILAGVPYPAAPDAAAAAAPAPAASSSHNPPPVYTDLSDVLGVHSGGPGGRRKYERTGHSEASYVLFLDLVERMLEYDQSLRIRPMAALNHPFLREDAVPAPDATGSPSAAPPAPPLGASSSAM